uniref:Phospholipid scramblase n=1 Tax=Aotus nancymaae TaxID=37293 RepID=A0A2K5CGQ3_AOTNA
MKPGRQRLPPRHIAYPKHQAGHTGKQAGPMGSQAFYPGRQHGYLVSPACPAGIPVQNQPGRPAGVPWMPAPPPLLNNTILIHQQIEPVEVLLCFESNNKYEIKNSFGQRIYFAAEDSHFCSRNCYGLSRPFTLRITDNLGREVITLERPLRCNSCCCPCCLQEIEIQAPPGVPIGYCISKKKKKEKKVDQLKYHSGSAIV